MNTNLVAGMQNIMGYFCQSIYRGDYDSCIKLFADNFHVECNLPDEKLFLCGKSEIAEHFKKRRKTLCNKGISREILIYNTPAFRTENTGGKGIWDVFVFRCGEKTDGKYKNVEPSFARIDCDFVEQNGHIRISRMDWYQLMNWTDWKYTKREKAIFEPLEDSMMEGFECNNLLNLITQIDAEDFVQLEQLISRFSHTNRLGAEKLFAEDKDISLYLSGCMEKAVKGYEAVCSEFHRLEKLEKNNDNNLICIPYVTAPMLWVSKDRQYAEGSFLVMNFQVKGKAFGYNSQNPEVVRSIGLLKTKFVKQKEQWKIKSYIYDEKYIFAPVHRHLNGCKWKPAVEATGNKKCAEDIFEIQGLMLEWTERLKTGRLKEYPDLFMSSAKDEITEWLSYDPKRKCVGYDAVMKDLNRMDYNYATKNLYKAAIVHCAMTPLIEISLDGTYAYGQWLDLCHTDLSQITGDYKIPVPTMMNACKYQHVYRKENGHWKLLHFTWGAFLAMDHIYADPTTWKGWVTYKNIPWPMPFERYILCENKDKK